MPHLSKQKLSFSVLQKIDDHIVSVLKETGHGTRQRIFREIFTDTERLMIGKRLTALYLITKDVPTHTISATLKLSPSTVARFENMRDKGTFIHTERWLKRSTGIIRLLELIADLTAIPIRAQRKSFLQMVRDIENS